MNDVGGPRVENHRLVIGRRGVLGRGDETGAHIGQIGAEQLRRENFVAVVEAAGQQYGLVEELTNLGQQGEWTPGAGMAASPGCHCDQAIHAGLGSFFGMAAGGHVMEHQATVAVHGIDHFLHRAQAGDDDGYAALDADGQVRLQAGVTVMHDQVDGEGRSVSCEAGFDLVKPSGEACAFALVQGRKAADDTAVAACNDQRRVGHQKHRRSDQRQAQALIEQGRQRHGELLRRGGRRPG